MFVAGQVGEQVVSPQVLLSMEEGLSSSHRLLVATHSIEKLPERFSMPQGSAGYALLFFDLPLCGMMILMLLCIFFVPTLPIDPHPKLVASEDSLFSGPVIDS
jgi:hypothetical protein